MNRYLLKIRYISDNQHNPNIIAQINKSRIQKPNNVKQFIQI